MKPKVLTASTIYCRQNGERHPFALVFGCSKKPSVSQTHGAQTKICIKAAYFEAKHNEIEHWMPCGIYQVKRTQKEESKALVPYKPKYYVCLRDEPERETSLQVNFVRRKDNGTRHMFEVHIPSMVRRMPFCDVLLIQIASPVGVATLDYFLGLPKCNHEMERNLGLYFDGRTDVASQALDCRPHMDEQRLCIRGKRIGCLEHANLEQEAGKILQLGSKFHRGGSGRLLSLVWGPFSQILRKSVSDRVVTYKPCGFSTATFCAKRARSRLGVHTPKASLSIALARVCQPLPSLLRRSMTIGSSIIVTRFLRTSLGNGGRPRRKYFKSSMVISLTSPSSSIIGSSVESVINFPFSIIGFAQRNNAQATFSHRVNQTNQSSIDKSKRDRSKFAIIFANVCSDHRCVPVKFRDVGEVQSAFFERALPFGFIPFQFHAFNMHTINRKFKRWTKSPNHSFVISIALAVTSSMVSAETLIGNASVIDADTIEIHGQRIRLEGIDAPESGQRCYHSNGSAWRCGQQASLAVSDIIGRRSVACRINSVDRYGRGLGTCYLGQTDLNGFIVNQGWALAYTRYSTRYVADQNAAQASRSGIWSSRFVAPWDWRRGVRLK